ncbi:PNK3P-domain-containing protein [Irpex rosettiformis]|uniref:PNK3P-domain-containing protein n=1 Tax=Irpex rosettiformis TaxID=378272 RepID=A0ACB8TXE2_9APHY|nr:PNK3P-domain-containing protein [Irpex rosettiformis]
MSSNKRTAAHLDQSVPNKAAKSAKLFPIFTKQPAAQEVEKTAFCWITPAIGPNKSCLHGVHLEPKATNRIAAFDLDGCLVESSFVKGRNVKCDKDKAPSFTWWRPGVPKKLKQIYGEGYSIIIVTNQNLRGKNATSNWKKKIPAIAASIPNVPFHIYAAIEKDGYRKPMPGMWYEIQRLFEEQGVSIDLDRSFFVGDAAGRKGDHSSSDRKWALNVGIPFSTPEEYFLGLKSAEYTLPGFDVTSLAQNVPPIMPTSTPLIPEPPTTEVVLFVGYPAMGKSTFYTRNFQSAGYVHVNQDALRTKEKCVKAVEEALEDGKSCVVDNTNRDKATRKLYIQLARKFNVPVRCIHFNGSIDLAWHNNLYRAFNLPDDVASKTPKRELLGYMAFTSFRNAYQAPTLDEGLSEIKQVNFIFEGSEEERRRWSMWLQIEGK